MAIIQLCFVFEKIQKKGEQEIWLSVVLASFKLSKGKAKEFDNVFLVNR
jgi:hypothetical protein